MCPFGSSFGGGNPYWQEPAREIRMNRSREANWLWHNQVFSGGHIGDDLTKDGELFDFDGRASSSEGRFPKIFKATYVEEDTLVYSAKTNFKRALGIFSKAINIIQHPENLTLSPWSISGGSASIIEDNYNDMRFTKIEGNGTANYVKATQGISFTTAGSLKYSFKAILKRGTSDQSKIELYDASVTVCTVTIDWTSDTITTYQIGYINYVWIDSDTIYIEATASVTSSTGGIFYILWAVDDLGVLTSDYIYATAISLEVKEYPLPYSFRLRDWHNVGYEYTWNAKGTMEFWFKPVFTYDRSDDAYFISDYWYDGSTNVYAFRFYYDATLDVFTFEIKGSSAPATISTSAFTSNDDLIAWHHIKLCWDTTNHSYSFYRNGALVGSDTTNIGTWSPNSYLSIGSLPFTNIAMSNIGDILICDLLVRDYIDESINHYLMDKPYFVPKEVSTDNTNFVLSEHGIQIKKGEISTIDEIGRVLITGGQNTLRALDKAGNIIHDAIDAQSAPLIYYLGHLYWISNGDLIETLTYDITDTATSYSPSIITGSIDMSSNLPHGMKNIRGVLMRAVFEGYIAGVKVKSDTYLSYDFQVDTKYDNPDTHSVVSQFIFQRTIYSQSQDADNIALHEYITAFLPFIIDYEDNIPYIRYALDLDMLNMTAVSGNYYLEIKLYLAGYFI